MAPWLPQCWHRSSPRLQLQGAQPRRREACRFLKIEPDSGGRRVFLPNGKRMACLSWPGNTSSPVPQQDEGWVGGFLTSLLGPASLRFGRLHAIQFPGGSRGLGSGWLGFLFLCAVSSLPPVLGPSLWSFLAFLSQLRMGSKSLRILSVWGVRVPLLAMALLLALLPSNPTWTWPSVSRL